MEYHLTASEDTPAVQPNGHQIGRGLKEALEVGFRPTTSEGARVLAVPIVRPRTSVGLMGEVD